MSDNTQNIYTWQFLRHPQEGLLRRESQALAVPVSYFQLCFLAFSKSTRTAGSSRYHEFSMEAQHAPGRTLLASSKQTPSSFISQTQPKQWWLPSHGTAPFYLFYFWGELSCKLIGECLHRARMLKSSYVAPRFHQLHVISLLPQHQAILFYYSCNDSEMCKSVSKRKTRGGKKRGNSSKMYLGLNCFEQSSN